jgi:4-aminobutyrate aminotransferase-like enzyme
MKTETTSTPETITHPDEPQSNDVRRRLARAEPLCQRTFTPSLAVIDRAEGSFLFTPEGRRLADFASGVLVANLGHNPARWWRRVCEHLGLDIRGDGDFLRAAPLTSYNAVLDIEVRASERLIDSLRQEPGGGRCEQVLWAASGSEAIQKALWAALARQPGKDVILATRHGFHGKKGLARAVTGTEQDPDRDPRVRFIAFPREECADIFRRRDKLDLSPYERELAALKAECGDRLCALITEPYLGGGGSYHPQPEYMRLLQRFCRDNGLVFILDEVQANFGRTGKMFAFSYYGVEPDIVVLGKGLGNGVPVAAAAGRADLFAALGYGEASDTYSGNPLACAAVLATLEEFADGTVLAHAAKLAGILEAGLARMQRELPIVAHVRGEGVVWGIEFADHGGHAAADLAKACVGACYRGDAEGNAIHLLGPLAGKVVRISPPLTMPLDDARRYMDAMFRIFAAVAAGSS